MRICLFVLVMMSLVAGAVHADTVHLKNGNTVEGKVIENTAEGVKMDIGGVTLTYYTDEIASIDADNPLVAAAVPEVLDREVVAQEALQSEFQVPALEASAVAATDDLAQMGKEALIRKFVQIYGVKENMQLNFDQMVTTLKPEQAQAFRQAVKVDEIVQLLLPIYDKHFSADDLRAYIRFYGSKEGKKLVQTLPLLMKDSVEVSMKYLDAHLPESLKQGESASGPAASAGSAALSMGNDAVSSGK